MKTSFSMIAGEPKLRNKFDCLLIICVTKKTKKSNGASSFFLVDENRKENVKWKILTFIVRVDIMNNIFLN